MLKLDLSDTPRWIDILPGVRFKLRPLTRADMILAGRAHAAAEDGDKNFAFTVKAVQRGLSDWSGIGDLAGKPIKPTEANIAAVLGRVPALYDAVDRLYVSTAISGEPGKNVSSPSPTGTSAAARNTARPAPKATQKTPSAPSAPIRSTPRKRTTKPSPGK